MRRRVAITACALTKTTELAARRVGVAPFLPALFALRYANMGGLDRDAFAAQLRRLHSFEDTRWCAHWDALARAHLDAAQAKVGELAGDAVPSLRDAMDGGGVDDLTALLAPAAWLLADHGPQASWSRIERLVSQHVAEPSARLVAAAVALDEIVKAITYFQVSAFPGGTPSRMRAYAASRALSDVVVAIVKAGLGLKVDAFEVEAAGEIVKGYAFVPDGPQSAPAVLVTNGLEGTVQELMIPMLRYRDRGMATFVMEMPGSYASRQPMSEASEGIYDAVIEHVARHPAVDAERLAMVGVSFGGYWSARLAATNPRLRCAVACGAPTHHSFQPTGSLGMPEIIIEAIVEVTGATNPIGLVRGLRALSLRDRYGSIGIPLLVINGDTDTLLSTLDSRELAEQAPRGELKLYPDDDHCAMGHYREWLDVSQQWLAEHLGPAR